MFVDVSNFVFGVPEIVLVVGVWDDALFECDVCAVESERFEQSFDDDGAVLEADVPRSGLVAVGDHAGTACRSASAAAALAVDGS